MGSHASKFERGQYYRHSSGEVVKLLFEDTDGTAVVETNSGRRMRISYDEMDAPSGCPNCPGRHFDLIETVRQTREATLDSQGTLHCGKAEVEEVVDRKLRCRTCQCEWTQEEMGVE